MSADGAAVHVLGVAHYRVEFADRVREAVERLRPAALAVELPSTLEAAVRRAVRRLPELSVVLYTTGAGDHVYLPIEPTDPLVEAIRIGLERELPVGFVDLDVDGYPDYREPLPDPWALTRLGDAAYARLARAVPRPRGPLDRRREQGMAWRARALAQRERGLVLLVCGLAHAEGIEQALRQGGGAEPLARVRRREASVWNLHPECLPEVLGEIPFVAAAYERRRQGGLEGPPPLAALVASRQVGPFRVVEGQRREEAAELRAAVERAARRAHGPGDPAGRPFDRAAVAAALFDEAELRHQAVTGVSLAPWQRRAFARFVRRLAWIDGQLVPDLYDLIVAARSCADDPFAYEIWRVGGAYPWQRETSDVPTARLSGSDLRLGTRRVRLRPRRRGARAGSPFDLRRRRGERWRGEWLAAFRGAGICSYPPEDLVVEDFGQRLRARTRALLREEHTRSEPFSVSLRDGLDLRETLRHWYEDELWVREQTRAPGEVGSVVVIFDEDREGDRYPFALTWHGEHEQESDMAFYATDPREAVVGPGICRARYGGFLLSHPPGRLAEVWNDPAYAMARSKPERLVLAALEYSVDPVVLLVAPRAPGARWKRWAERLDRRLVYLPLGQFSRTRIERLRVLHILDGRDRREIAPDYVW